MRVQASRKLRHAQAEMPVRRGAIQPGDQHHVGVALGGEVHRALAERRAATRRRPPDRQAPTPRRTRSAIEDRSPSQGGWLIARRPCRRSGSSCPSGSRTASPASPPAAAAGAPGQVPAAARAARRHTIRALNVSMPPGKPSIGQASAARNWNSSSRRSRSETFGAEPCTARTWCTVIEPALPSQRDGLAVVDVAVRRVHRAAEHAVGVVVEDRARDGCRE